MSFKPLYPFDNYLKGYIVDSRDGRKMVILFNSDKDRTTISLARYNLSIQLKRLLNRDEHVDHIDNDKTNDKVENLQILSPLDNLMKYKNTIKKVLVDYQCPICSAIFTLKYHRSPASVASKKAAYCSRSCGARGGWLQPVTKIIEVGRRFEV